MLTSELLKANTALEGLTDEQVSAIVTLSQNDENVTIANKTGKIYGDLDADILSTSNISKNGTEKTYDYAKRVITELKTKAESADALQTQVNSLLQKNAKLEKSIAEGSGDAEMTKKVKQLEADLASVTATYAKQSEEIKKQAETYEETIRGLQIENELKMALSGVKFKPELPESATKLLIEQAIGQIKAMPTEMVDDGKGNKVRGFKDANGAVMRNQTNQLMPYTATELLNNIFEGMGILDKGRQAAGGGTTVQTQTQAAPSINISVEGAKTRLEAFDAINRMLEAQGLKAGTKAYDDAMTQAWKDNNISKLPER